MKSQKTNKFFLYLLMLSLTLFCSCKSDNNKAEEATKSYVDEIVSDPTLDSSRFYKELNEIKENFKRINSIKKWTVIDSVELFNSAEGGQAKFYFANKQLQKITAVYYGESGKQIEEYYLLNSKLSFVYKKDYKYNRPISWDSSIDGVKFDLNKSKISETRSYFHNDVLFEQIKSADNKSIILLDNLNNAQKSIKADYNNLKQKSLVRQI